MSYYTLIISLSWHYLWVLFCTRKWLNKLVENTSLPLKMLVHFLSEMRYYNWYNWHMLFRCFIFWLVIQWSKKNYLDNVYWYEVLDFLIDNVWERLVLVKTWNLCWSNPTEETIQQHDFFFIRKIDVVNIGGKESSYERICSSWGSEMRRWEGYNELRLHQKKGKLKW